MTSAERSAITEALWCARMRCLSAISRMRLAKQNDKTSVSMHIEDWRRYGVVRERFQQVLWPRYRMLKSWREEVRDGR